MATFNFTMAQGIKERILAARRQLYELKARYIELYARWHGRVDNGLMQLFQRDDDFYSNAVSDGYAVMAMHSTKSKKNS